MLEVIIPERRPAPRFGSSGRSGLHPRTVSVGVSPAQCGGHGRDGEHRGHGVISTASTCERANAARPAAVSSAVVLRTVALQPDPDAGQAEGAPSRAHRAGASRSRRRRRSRRSTRPLQSVRWRFAPHRHVIIGGDPRDAGSLRRAHPEQPQVPGHGLGPVGRVQLAQDAVDVELDRPGRRSRARRRSPCSCCPRRAAAGPRARAWSAGLRTRRARRAPRAEAARRATRRRQRRCACCARA